MKPDLRKAAGGEHPRDGLPAGPIKAKVPARIRVPEGEVVVPAKQFSEAVTWLLTTRGSR